MMLCYMCKVRGEAKYIKSVDSFSAAMRRGDYGKYATSPFCLMHTAGDQRNWVDGLEMQAQCGLLSSYTGSNEVETEQLTYAHASPRQYDSSEKYESDDSFVVSDCDGFMVSDGHVSYDSDASDSVSETNCVGSDESAVADSDGPTYSRNSRRIGKRRVVVSDSDSPPRAEHKSRRIVEPLSPPASDMSDDVAGIDALEVSPARVAPPLSPSPLSVPPSPPDPGVGCDVANFVGS